LAEMGFDARWGVLGAADVGAPHQRDRIWIVATQPERVAGRVQPGRRDGARRSDSPVAWDDGLAQSLADANGSGCEGTRSAQPEEDDAAVAAWSGSGVADAASARRSDTEDARTNSGDALSWPWGIKPERGGDVANADGAPGGSKERVPEPSAGGMPDGVGTVEFGGRRVGDDIPDADGAGLEEQRQRLADETKHAASERCGGGWWSRAQSGLGGTSDGVAEVLDAGSPWSEGWEYGTPRTIGAKEVSNRPARLKAIGNGQVPQCAALAWRRLTTTPD